MIRIKFLVILVVAMAASACAKVEEMKATTEHMKQTTDKMADTSDHMANRMDQMKTGSTFFGFEELIQLVFGENENPGATPGGNNEGRMALYAGAAVRALDFQFWSASRGQTVASLDHDMSESVQSFFLRTTNYIKSTGQVNVWVPDRNFKGLGSLGAMLDETDSKFKKATERAGLGKLNLYELIVRALGQRSDVKAGDPLSKSVETVLKWKHEAVHFLQMRHIYLPMLVVTRMSDFPDRGNMSRLWLSLQGQEIDLSKFEDQALREWIKWLDKAQETRQTLTDLGYDLSYNRQILRMQKAFTFKQQNVVGALENSLSSRQLLEREFLNKFAAIHAVTVPGLMADQHSNVEAGKNTGRAN